MKKNFLPKLCLILLLSNLFSQKLAAFSPPDTLVGTCDFIIEWNLIGLNLAANLKAKSPNSPIAPAANWTINGQSISKITNFSYKFQQLGDQILCAKYANSSGDSCVACQAIRVLPPYDGCLDYRFLNSSIGCTTVFEPVCGCDNVTYGNECPAIYYHGVTRWWKGLCGSQGDCQNLLVNFKTESSGNLAMFSDKTTFSSGTILGWSWIFDEINSSSEQNPSYDFGIAGDHKVCLTVTAQKPGGGLCISGFCKIITVGQTPCIDSSLINPDLACPAIYDPVCGCDGKTYGNACEAVIFGGNVTFTPGVCGHNCVDSSWINLDGACNTIYIPVCGCDNKTYENSCYALYQNGITSWVSGVCPVVSENKTNAENLLVKIFPNPILDILNIDFPNEIASKISIFDATGRLFLVENSPKRTMQLDLSQIPSGLLFIKIASQNGVLTKKMVKY